MPLELQARFAGAVGDGTDHSVILEAAAVKDHGLDPLALGALGDELADTGGRVDAATGPGGPLPGLVWEFRRNTHRVVVAGTGWGVELAKLFNRLGLDTQEVLEAAGTKWNFLPFRPGLVGGHCIGVDPYYLTYKATEVGYHPEMILAGRRLNDGMGAYVVEQAARLMTQKRIHVVGADVLIMGLAFKENCPDLRNTKVVDIVGELASYGMRIDIHDPWVDRSI